MKGSSITLNGVVTVLATWVAVRTPRRHRAHALCTVARIEDGDDLTAASR